MEALYGWIFTYNPYTKKWLATQRDNYMALFNSSSVKDNYIWNDSKIIQSSSFNTLIDIIVRTDGKPDLLDKKVKVELY